MARVSVAGESPAKRFLYPPALSLGIDLVDEDAQVVLDDLSWPDSPDGLSVLLARSQQGQVAIYPIVESRDQTFLAPARIPDELATRIQLIALHLAAERHYVGILTVTLDNDLKILQIHSGPHRSGLWTMDGSRTGQFEQHLRAVLNLPLGDPSMNAPMALTQMVVGGEKPDLFTPYLHLFARDPGLRVHLYGVDVEPGREIGHVTVLGEKIEDLQQRADHAAGYLNGRIEE